MASNTEEKAARQVLIGGDDLVFCEMARLMVNGTGYGIATADHGYVALEGVQHRLVESSYSIAGSRI